MNEQTAGDDDITVATEHSPLLRIEDNSEIPDSFWKPGHSRSSTLTSSIASATISVPTAEKPGTILGIFFLLIFVSSAADAFKQIPMTRIFEDILCHDYYDKTSGSDAPIDEELCKVNAIQTNLAYLLAVLESLNSGVACLVALLWGIVADRVGRKPVLLVCLMGMLLSLVWVIIVGWFSYALSPQLFLSKRYHMRLGETGYVQSIYGVAHIAVVLIAIPSVSEMMTKPSAPSWIRLDDKEKRDLVLVRWFYAASMTGAFILGISPSLSVFVVGLVVMSLGSISSSFIKSIAASHVDFEHRSRLFTIIAIVEVGSNIWTMPALAGLFALGMKLGGGWIGLPYLGVSLTCLAMLVLSFFVRVPATESDNEESPLDYEPVSGIDE
ncbi:hypothetical protein ABKA04_004768 [Annulohypoxylon sp. FPYF3050]